MHMDNNQMRAMYNSFGTLNRPQSYGDDLYNDRENLMPAQPMTQTGEDEAGNPIMAPVQMPEAENKPILDNVMEFAANVGPAEQPGPIGAITDTVASYITGNDEQRQQILDRMQRFTPQGIESGIKSVIHSMSNATELEHTKLYENYFYNAEKKNAEIKRIANLLQIDENSFAHNRELYQKAALAADRVERMGKFKKYQDANGDIDMARIYADVPGLAEIQQKQGTAAAALALGNIDGIQSINDVYDNAFSRFAGSVYAGARRGYIADRRSAIWNTARKEKRMPNAEEQALLDEYAAELNTLPKYNYNTVGNVMGAMVGGAAENLAMIVKSQGAGMAAGLVAGRIGGAKAGEVARNIASTYVMAQDIAGNQYEELVNKVDANGRPVYTPEQASYLALAQGAGEAVLEQWSLNQMGKAIFGQTAAKSITEIIKNSPTVEAAKAGIRDYAALKLSEAGKAGIISLGSEAFEEFTQQASDMLMENMAQVMLKGKDADVSSVEDILAASTGAMVEALPAIGGFGLIGFGMNPIANTRAVLGFRSNVRNVVNNKVLIGRMANAHYGEVLDGVWKNKGNIKELQDKSPESVTTILDTQNRLAGMEDGFVDVRELSKENADLVNKIAEANDVSQEELAACLDGSGMLQVKTSTLMQLDLKDEQHKAIRDNVTTSLDAFTTAQENIAIKLVKEQMDSLQAFNDKTYKQAVENIIQARFPDAEQAKLAREIIEANYDNPQEEFKRRLDAVNAEIDEYVAPVLKELKSGMKQGVDVIRVEGERDAKYVKQSNNADWYRNWYADKGKAPTNEELLGLAIDIASGRQNARYGLMDYQNNTDESRQYFGNVAQTLDRLEEQRNALMAIQDRMRDLNPGEMVATANLSKEGLKVYDAIRKMMGKSENKDVRKAGAFNALFLARYADNMAKVMAKVKKAPYTAEDFVRDRFKLDVNAEYSEEQMAAQLFQQGKTAKGSIALTQQGQRIINLFESADQSTFIHELAHMFLLDLQEIAGIDPNSQQAKDLKAIMDWAEYKTGQVDEYKGTASAEEFRKRDAAIKEAEAKGDKEEAKRLKEVWAQERFARAFEEYLRTGEAPAQGLKRAFRAFKKWLVQIYNDVLGAGVRATPEVEAVMARMVASEEEIDAMEAANAVERIRKVDADILSDDAQAMIQRWQTEAKEQAKEKMLKELMKQYEQNNLKDIEKRLEEFKAVAREQLQNTPCFVCEQLIKDGTDMASALEITGFANQDEYTVALIQNGGSLENALNKMVEQAKANMLTEMPSKDKLYSMAEEALLSGDYNTRLAELEAQLLKRRQARYDNIPARLRNAFSEMDEAIKEFEAAKVKEAVKKLKYAERWDAKNFETIKELESYLAKMERQEEDRANLIEKFNKRYNELKEVTVRNTKWLQGVRDATLGHARVLQAAAVFRLAEESVSVATNARYWHREALREAKRAWDNITGAQRTGKEVNYNEAVNAKQQQAIYDAMTAQAIKNKKQLDKWLNGARDGFKARAKRMADPKVKANVDMRYFHNHLLYIFGLRNSDAIPPTNYKSFQDVLAELRASHQFEDDVPAWLVSAAEQNDPGKNYQQLTMGELEELYKLTRVLYRLAVNDNGLLTMDVDMDTIVAECTEDWLKNTDYEVGNQRINEVKGAIGTYMNGLLKPEVLLSLLGGEQGGFVKYIYRVLFTAAENEEIAREKEAKAQRELYSKYYTKEELRAMVNDPVMITMPDGQKVKLAIGEDTDITKENLICMALNWGNEANKARLLVGLFDCENETQLIQRENELKAILESQLTKKDWEFVQAMWDHIGEFADPVSDVMEKSVGVPLDRVKAEAFDVALQDGEVIRLPGGYYPIVKDSSKSTRQSEFEQVEEAKALGGVSVFGTGMSATKERADNKFLNQGPLKLTLDVANNHITAQIHLINAKMAVRDAYKVINNKQIQDMVRRTCGEETVKTMNDWVLNCWAPPIRPRSWYENIAASLRSKTVGAIMGYRVSTALLNSANIVYMAQEIGTKNTLAAIVDFYRHPVENRKMILDISVYMRNRATNMDRDLQAQNDAILKRHSAVGNAIDKATSGKSEDLRYQMEKYSNWLIEQTDMMLSMPLYMWQYKQTYSEEIAKGVPEEEARETANYEAVRRMTKVFPSSRAVDTSAIQRTKSEMTKLITPFFSFANTMMNAVWSKYYAGKFKGNERIEMLDNNGQPMLDENGEPIYTTVKKSFVKRYGRFARAILFNFVLGAVVETLLRQVPDALAGTGDDDEDKLLADMRKNILQSAMAGFPGINEATNFLYESFFEKPSYMGGRGVGVLSGTVQRYSKVVTDLAKITQGKGSIDVIDLFRDIARASNTKTGISDTLTDAMFNTARFIGDDYRFDDMADLREYIAKTIFDRKLKKK